MAKIKQARSEQTARASSAALEAVPLEELQETSNGDGASETSPEAEELDGTAEVDDTEILLKGLVEAILFVTDRPLELKELARAARIDRKRCAELLDKLREEYADRAIHIDEVAGGYLFRTDRRFASQVHNFLSQRPVRLSRAQLETLAIVAYRQPITRPEVDDVRGVDCGPVLKGLLDRELIRILGKKDEPGRPILYGTTPAFLELFSLQSLRDLPTLREFTELSADSQRVFERELGEEAPEGPLESLLGAQGDEQTEGSDDADSQSQPAVEAAQGGAPDDQDDEGEDEDKDEDDDDEDDDDEDDDDEDEDDEDEDDEDDG
jgi:segregation and condensation protein B